MSIVPRSTRPRDSSGLDIWHGSSISPRRAGTRACIRSVGSLALDVESLHGPCLHTASSIVRPRPNTALEPRGVLGQMSLNFTEFYLIFLSVPSSTTCPLIKSFRTRAKSSSQVALLALIASTCVFSIFSGFPMNAFTSGVVPFLPISPCRLPL